MAFTRVADLTVINWLILLKDDDLEFSSWNLCKEFTFLAWKNNKIFKMWEIAT